MDRAWTHEAVGSIRKPNDTKVISIPDRCGLRCFFHAELQRVAANLYRLLVAWSIVSAKTFRAGGGVGAWRELGEIKIGRSLDSLNNDNIARTAFDQHGSFRRCALLPDSCLSAGAVSLCAFNRSLKILEFTASVLSITINDI